MSMAGGGLGKVIPNWTFLGTKVNDPGGLFQPPVTPPTPPTPPPAPTAMNSQGPLDVAAQQEALALSRGRAATILTAGGGLPNQGQGASASKLLLGS